MQSTPEPTALEQAVADPPEVPEVRAASDLTGLARRSVRPIDLLGNSVAVIAPAASALSVPFVLVRFVGPGAWISAMVGFGLALMLGSVFSQYATRIAASGSMYTWVTRSLGPFPGIIVGTSMLLGYGTLVAFGVSHMIRKSDDALTSMSSGNAGLGVPGQSILGIAAVTACLLVCIRGVRWSTRLAFVVESSLIVALVVLVALALGRDGLPSLSTFSIAGADPWRVVLGATIVMGITVGFESSAALAGEAAKPFLSVPRAMVGSVVVAGVLYTMSMLAANSLAGPDGQLPRGPAQRWFPGSVDAHLADALLNALLAVSFFALALCAWNALARVVFSFAREGILPAFLGLTHDRWHSPVWALVAVLPVSILPTTLTLLSGRRVGELTLTLLQAAVLVLVIAYALVALSLPVFLLRLDEWTWSPVIVALAAAALTLVIAGIDTYEDVRHGDYVGVTLAGATLVLGVVWFCWLRSHRRRALRRMGIHDETITSDLLGG